MHHPSVLVPLSVSAALALSMAAHGGVIFTGTQLRVQASVPAASTTDERVAGGVEESLFADVSIQTWLHQGQFPDDHWYLPGAYTSCGAQAQNRFGQAGIVLMGTTMEWMNGATQMDLTCNFTVTDSSRGYAAELHAGNGTGPCWSAGFIRVIRDGSEITLEQAFAIDPGRDYHWSAPGELAPGSYTLQFEYRQLFSDSPNSANRSGCSMVFAMPTPGAAALLVATAGLASRRRR